MEAQRKYVPLDCLLHDELESFATLRTRVTVEYRSATDAVHKIEDVIVDIFNRSGVEFLKLATGVEIRLDDLVSVNRA